MGSNRCAPAAVITVFILTAFTLTGCPPVERPAGPEADLSAIGPVVDPERCIRTVMEAYEEYGDPGAVAKYAGVLHPGYRFHFQPGDVTRAGRPFLDREEDIIVTGRIFASATFLYLDISEGAWYRLWHFENEECEGCYTTTRNYTIIARFGENGRTYRGTDVITIIAVPDPGLPDRFVIRAIYDIDDD